MKEPLKTKFIETAKRLSNNSWNELARKIKIKIPKDKGSTLIRNYRRCQSTSLFLVKKISKFLVNYNYNEFSLEAIQKNLRLIKTKGPGGSIINPKFPLDFNSKEGAIVISTMFHDGGITTRDLSPFYANTSKKLISRFNKAIMNLVGSVEFLDREEKGVQLPKIIGLVLTTLGLVPGKRSINNPKFPKFIFNYNEELILEFLSQAIADDGWVYCPDNGFGFIGFNFTVDLTRFSEKFRQEIRNRKILRYLPNTLLGNIKLFEKIGCSAAGPHFGNKIRYHNEEGMERRYTQEWRMQVRGYKNLKFLSKKLNIPLGYKQEKLIKESNKIRLRKV